MLDYNADDLSDQEIQTAADMMAENPELANKLGAILEKIAFNQGWVRDTLEEHSKKFDHLSAKIDAMSESITNIDRNFGVFGEKLDRVEKRLPKD